MNRTEKLTIVVTATILVVMLTVCLIGDWYKAGVQRDVYRRQGVEMSRWEVFLGAKPVERYIQQSRPGR